MIAPVWLLTAWRYLKPALPYLAGAVAVWLAYGWAFDRGSASRQPEIAAITRDRDTARANAKAAQASIDNSNAARMDLQRRYEAASKAAESALAAVAVADKRAAGYRARADALAAAKPVGACLAPEGDRLSAEVWERL